MNANNSENVESNSEDNLLDIINSCPYFHIVLKKSIQYILKKNIFNTNTQIRHISWGKFVVLQKRAVWDSG
jgi:hypothetical protein